MGSPPTDIDQGFAWCILAACIILTCFEHTATTGIFYLAILEKYHKDHYATIWIQTLQTGMLYLAGLIAGMIIEKKGCRFIALLAGCIYTLSFLTSCFAPSLEVLYISLGIGTGFSQSLLNVTVFAIIPHYFDQKLGMAVGFTQSGVGIGLLVFSALNGYLVATYGLQGAFLILAGIAAHTIPLGILMRKPASITVRKLENETTTLDVPDERQFLLTDEKQSLLENGNDLRSNEFEIPIKSEDDFNSESNMPDKKHHSCYWHITSIFYTTGLDLFKNKYYTLLVLATTFISLPHNMVPTIIPDHIKWTGWTEFQATSSLMIIGAANTLSRLFFWKISKDDVIRSIDILTVSSLLSGTGLACTLFLHEYWMYVILCIVYGITRGVYMIYYSLLLIQIVGKDRGHHGYGVCSTIKGIVILITMSSFGVVTDLTYHVWGYNIVFLSLGSCEIVACFILIGMRMLYCNSLR